MNHVIPNQVGGSVSIPFHRRSSSADTVGLVSPRRTKSNPRGVGRPPSGEETASKNLTIRLKPSQLAAYEAASEAAGVSLADWIRASCDARLPKRKRG
jgi:hypothetical protein